MVVVVVLQVLLVEVVLDCYYQGVVVVVFHTAVHMSSIIKVNAQEKFLCRKLICGPYIMLYVVDKL